MLPERARISSLRQPRTFRAWTESDNFKAQHAGNRKLGAEAFTGPVKLEVHEIAQESGASLAVSAS